MSSLGLLSEKTVVYKEIMWYGFRPRGIKIGNDIVSVKDDRTEIVVLGVEPYYEGSALCRQTTPDQWLFDLRKVLVEVLGKFVARNINEPEVVVAEMTRLHAIPELSYLLRSGTWCESFKVWVEALLWEEAIGN